MENTSGVELKPEFEYLPSPIDRLAILGENGWKNNITRSRLSIK
jgi:hypothetical protein